MRYSWNFSDFQLCKEVVFPAVEIESIKQNNFGLFFFFFLNEEFEIVVECKATLRLVINTFKLKYKILNSERNKCVYKITIYSGGGGRESCDNNRKTGRKSARFALRRCEVDSTRTQFCSRLKRLSWSDDQKKFLHSFLNKLIYSLRNIRKPIDSLCVHILILHIYI